MTFTRTQAKLIINRVYASGGIHNSTYTIEEYEEALKVKFGKESEGLNSYFETLPRRFFIFDEAQEMGTGRVDKTLDLSIKALYSDVTVRYVACNKCHKTIKKENGPICGKCERLIAERVGIDTTKWDKDKCVICKARMKQEDKEYCLECEKSFEESELQ